jgi:hypothetical protein
VYVLKNYDMILESCKVVREKRENANGLCLLQKVEVVVALLLLVDSLYKGDERSKL